MVICMEHKCHSSLKPSDFLLSVVYNSDTGEKVGDFHEIKFNDTKDMRFHEIKFNDTKDKTNVSNAIVSLANSTDYIRVYMNIRPQYYYYHHDDHLSYCYY